MNALPVAIALGLTCASVSACTRSTSPSAPAPLPGPTSSTGTITLSIKDPARRDPVDPTHAREWVVGVFYPTAPARVTGVYADDPALVEALVADGYYGATAGELRAWATRPAAAIDHAPPQTPTALPVVTISPGLGFARLNYAELASALVARGYVVVVIDHPYIGYTHLPDGRLLRSGDYPALNSDDPRDALPAIRDWTRDVTVTLDRLGGGAAREALPGLSLDTSRVVAAGHSIGGTAAIDACGADPRVLACIDFEGFTEGTRASEEGARRPTLMALSRAKGRPATVPPGQPDPAGRALDALGKRGEPVWIVKITGGSHTSFSDAPDVLPRTLSRFGGELMSPARSVSLYTGMVDAFARAYAPGEKGAGEAVFQRFLDGAPETNGRHAPPR